MTTNWRTWIAGLALAGGWIAGPLGANAAEPLDVVELFTSQGCSSCPPADKLLGEFARQPNVLALTYHVDYWDYLGWKDTLASPRFTERQRSYARTLGATGVYTPQAVINGTLHAVGSNRAKIEAAIAKSKASLAGRQPDIRAWRKDAMIEVRISKAATAPARPATVWLAVVKPSVEVPILRGENHGSKIRYTNVVRSISPIGTWTGDEQTLKLQERSVMSENAELCVIVVQDGTNGPILAASWARPGN